MLQNDDRLAELIKQRGPQPESDTSLWACLSRCVNYKDGTSLPLQSVAANAGIFFAAGYETTAHAISWALFELAADTAIQVGIFIHTFIHLGIEQAPLGRNALRVPSHVVCW